MMAEVMDVMVERKKKTHFAGKGGGNGSEKKKK